MEQPPDVDGQLVRFRTRQQHAVVEGMEESGLANPSLLLDEDAMHDRDLPCRATKAQQRNAYPYPKRFTECDAMARHNGRRCPQKRILSHGACPLGPAFRSMHSGGTHLKDPES